LKYCFTVIDKQLHGWDELLSNVTSFCQRNGIGILYRNDVHSTARYGRSRIEEN
jgi:hypothetical protein